jgi:hypothetical protein
LQAPTSVAFLGMLALAPLPWPPRPQPALPPFLPHPPRPALEVQAIFPCLKGPTDGWMMTLAKNPWIHYRRSCWAVSSMNHAKSMLLHALQNPTNPTFLPVFMVRLLRSCQSSWQDCPSSLADLYA